jgi:spore coat protein U-like protein
LPAVTTGVARHRPDGGSVRRVKRSIVLALALSLASGPLYGAGCTIVSAGSMGFGTYDVFETGPLDTTGSISYSCSQPVVDPVIRISTGMSGTFAQRTLSNGSSSLGYNLYRDAARTQVWSDGPGGTHATPADNQTVTVTIFGRIPPRQNVAAGSYSDSVTVTLDF